MRTFLAACMCLLLAGCSVLTPQQRDNARAFVQREYDAGNITAAQRDAAVEALDKDKPADWEGIGLFGINALLALIGGPLIVRAQRGVPTQKAGLPQSMVKA